MIKHFENLTKEEIEFLLKAPVLVSVLAARINDKISTPAKADAIKLAHLKTFTAVELLRPYYNEVEKNFKVYFDSIVKKISPFDEEKMEAFKEELSKLNILISRLDKEFGNTLRWSLSKYAAHVKKAERVLLTNFIFPFKLPGLTD